MITIHRISEPITSLYNPHGDLIGYITNSLELNDIRIQIKEQQLSGYFVKYLYHEIDIDKDGGVDFWPSGFYDKSVIQLNNLLGI